MVMPPQMAVDFLRFGTDLRDRTMAATQRAESTKYALWGAARGIAHLRFCGAAPKAHAHLRWAAEARMPRGELSAV